MKDLNTKFIKFFSNKKGSVAIEFVLLITVLIFMFAFMVDLVLLRSTTGKLERVSYSLLNVAKERTQFYGDNQLQISRTEVNNMQKLAANLLYGSGNNKKVDVILELLEVTDPANPNQRNSRQVKRIITESTNNNNCMPQVPIAKLVTSAPISEELRSVPLYQVTICIETNSLFKALLVSKSNQNSGLLRVSSYGPIR